MSKCAWITSSRISHVKKVGPRGFEPVTCRSRNRNANNSAPQLVLFLICCSAPSQCAFTILHFTCCSAPSECAITILHFICCLAPSESPQNVTAMNTNDSSTLLVWQCLSKVSSNGKILGYKVILFILIVALSYFVVILIFSIIICQNVLNVHLCTFVYKHNM